MTTERKTICVHKIVVWKNESGAWSPCPALQRVEACLVESANEGSKAVGENGRRGDNDAMVDGGSVSRRMVFGIAHGASPGEARV